MVFFNLQNTIMNMCVTLRTVFFYMYSFIKYLVTRANGVFEIMHANRRCIFNSVVFYRLATT